VEFLDPATVAVTLILFLLTTVVNTAVAEFRAGRQAERDRLVREEERAFQAAARAAEIERGLLSEALDDTRRSVEATMKTTSLISFGDLEEAAAYWQYISRQLPPIAKVNLGLLEDPMRLESMIEVINETAEHLGEPRDDDRFARATMVEMGVIEHFRRQQERLVRGQEVPAFANDQERDRLSRYGTAFRVLLERWIQLSDTEPGLSGSAP
jgi:hypothetical protein